MKIFEQKKGYRFRTNDNVRMCVTSLSAICTYPLALAFLMVLIFEEFVLSLLIVCVCLFSFPPTVFLLLFLFDSWEYCVDDQYITKHKGNKVILKIQRKELQYFSINKVKRFGFFKFFLGAFLSGSDDAAVACTRISFSFSRSEIFNDSRGKTFVSLKMAEDLMQITCVENLSYKQAKKMAKVLGKLC